MALSANTVWELRTAGDVANGGGFVTGASGTDFSQQDAAQYALTGVTSAGAGNVILTASAAADMVGNIINVISGTNFTVGFFQITSVSVGVSITCSTNRSGTAISTGVGATGVMNIGGALPDPALLAVELTVSGMSVYQKAGTYTITSASTNVAGGCVTFASRVRWEGYQTTRGDFGTKPVFLASGISTAVIFTAGTNDCTTVNLEIDGASLTSIRGFATTSRSFFHLCTARNCTNSGFSGSATTLFSFCLTSGCSTQASFLVPGKAFACVAMDNTILGFSVTSGGLVVRCIADTNTGATVDGFLFGAAANAVNCVAYGNGRDGFACTTGNAIVMTNCLSESNGQYGYNGSAAPKSLFYCGAYGNSSGPTNGTYEFNVSFITGSASFFTNAAAGDFSLNTDAGGGALARAAGLPGVLPGGLTTGYLDVGAAQHADSPDTISVSVQSPHVTSNYRVSSYG